MLGYFRNLLFFIHREQAVQGSEPRTRAVLRESKFQNSRGPPTSGTKTRAEASLVFFGRILNFCNSLRWASSFPVETVDGFPRPGESVRGSRPPGERLGTGLTSSPT